MPRVEQDNEDNELFGMYQQFLPENSLTAEEGDESEQIGVFFREDDIRIEIMDTE